MKKLLIAILVGSLAVVSCTKSLNINNNPNQPTSVTPNVVLSAALVGSAANVSFDYPNLPCWLGYWSRSGNYVPDVQTETYNIANDYTNTEWGNIYTNMKNYIYIERVGQTSGLPFYVGVAKVMKAYNMSTLVDLYNNVPYSDAFKVGTEVQPKFDDAQTIYNDLVSELDSSIIYFENAKTYYTTVATSTTINTDNQYDVVYGGGRPNGSSDPVGRMTLWEQFANTLELKLLIHQSQVSSQQTFIQTEIAKIVANGFGFIGAGQSANVNPGYQPSTGKDNPFYGNFYAVTGSTTPTQNYYRAEATGVNFYINTVDNRGFFFYSAVGNSIAGNHEGDPASLPNSNISAVGPGLLKGYTQDQLLLSDFESLFLQAEAVQRGWLSGNAQTLYQNAITANYVYLYNGVTVYGPIDPNADALAYYTSGLADVDWTASPNKLEAIMTQKWAALNGINWTEAWTDYRRTGIPNLPITSSPTHLVPQIPVRYLYPQVELNTNGANVPKLGNNAQFTAKIFWNQ
jgi:hypothetical protein